jgi:FKBP-type peptidyl-prolyl cis-trans isomerase FkpA
LRFIKKEIIVRKSLLPVVLLLVMFTSVRCMKSDPCSPKTVASEAPEIEAYATANGITATQHASGLYYEVVDPGAGATPSLNSKIAITYTGKFLDGTTFDERLIPNNDADPTTQEDDPWRLGDLIEAWQIGLPLIQKGGHIKLIVPSAMAYGCTGFRSIPGNKILYFDIHLFDVVP